MLPFEEIWSNIIKIQEFNLPCNLKKTTKEDNKLTFDDVVSLKNEFLMSTIDLAQNIDGLMTVYEDIDFTIRYKDEDSIKRNWENVRLTKPLNKTLNDILGMRFILKTKKDNLKKIVQEFIDSCPLGEDKCRFVNLEKEGYEGIHVYVMIRNNTFPLEVQFWTRTDALLNQYLRDTIYARFDDSNIIRYAEHLLNWLEQIPLLDGKEPIKSYIDYLYEKAFHDEDDDTDV